MNTIDDNTISRIQYEIEQSLVNSLESATKTEFKTELKNDLTDILIKILSEEGYIDGIDKEQIRNEISILFENSDSLPDTNNNILEHTDLLGGIDNDTLKKLNFSGEDIKAFRSNYSW